MHLIMSDNDHERSEVPRLVLHVLCGREREEEGEGEREARGYGRERGREKGERGVERVQKPCTPNYDAPDLNNHAQAW